MSPKNQPELSSSSPLPYPLRSVEEGFVFETAFGLTYSIRFTDDSDYVPQWSPLAGSVFSFSITPIAGEVKQKDPRVERTVIEAVLSTFEASPNVVINYVCSLEANQEIARSRLFHSWYLKVGSDRFVKLDRTDYENRIYTSVIFRRNHSAEAEIRSRFNESFDK